MALRMAVYSSKALNWTITITEKTALASLLKFSPKYLNRFYTAQLNRIQKKHGT